MGVLKVELTDAEVEAFFEDFMWLDGLDTVSTDTTSTLIKIGRGMLELIETKDVTIHMSSQSISGTTDQYRRRSPVDRRSQTDRRANCRFHQPYRQ